MLREDGVPVTLSIIGNGPQEDDLRDLVRTLDLEDHVVHFLGTMTQKAVIDHYRTCDLFVLACAVASNGDMDGLPTVLIESLALEIPSVSTQVSGVPEIIIDGETGLCVPPHDVDALAGAIRYMIEHPDAAQQMAKQGRTLVESRFDRQKNADVLYDLWKDIV